MNILGIETSCDETAVAIVTDKREILANLVLSQLEEHSAFGGVVPEIAARAHLDHLDTLIRASMQDSGLKFEDLDGIAATCGPGLIGGVMIGMMAGKAIAAGHGKPFIAVNHLEAHALTARLTDDVAFPYLLLLVSGGHTQILVVESVGQYRNWGGTIDDAMGECFDKSAKLMGLPYPGGPNLEKAAAQCKDPLAAIARFPLPKPMYKRPEPDFSFSGLKTAMRNHVEKLPEGPLKPHDVADLACAFQHTVSEIAEERCEKAVLRFKEHYKTDGTLVVSGGVAANRMIRSTLHNIATRHSMAFSAPPLALCSDNGAMIAWTGVERLRLGLTDRLDFAARPRWPLEEKRNRTS
jgi:N6-L-threonylcarbamoyladenine synthase